MVDAAGARQQFTTMVDGFKLSRRLQCSADGSTFQAVRKKGEASSLSHIVSNVQTFLKANHDAIEASQASKLNTLLDRRIIRLRRRMAWYRRLFLSAENKETIANAIKELQSLQLVVTRSFGPACQLDRIIAGFRAGNRVGITLKEEAFARIHGSAAANWQAMPEKIVRERKNVFGKVQAFLDKHQAELDLGKLDALDRHLNERAERLRRRQYGLFSTFLSSAQNQKIKGSIEALKELSEFIQSIKRGTQQEEQSAFFGTGVTFGLGKGPGLGPGMGPGLGEGKGPGLGEGKGPGPGPAAAADFDPARIHAQERPEIRPPLFPEAAAEEIPPPPPPPPPPAFDLFKKKPKEFKPILPGEPKPPSKKCLTFKQADIARLSREELKKQIAILQDRIDLLGQLLEEIEQLLRSYDVKTKVLSKVKEDKLAVKSQLSKEQANLDLLEQAEKDKEKISITHATDKDPTLYIPDEMASSLYEKLLQMKRFYAEQNKQAPAVDESFIDRTLSIGKHTCQKLIQELEQEIKECDAKITGLKDEIAALKKQKVNGTPFEEILRIQDLRKLLQERRKSLELWKRRLNTRLLKDKKWTEGNIAPEKPQPTEKVTLEQAAQDFPDLFAEFASISTTTSLPQQVKAKQRAQAFHKKP